MKGITNKTILHRIRLLRLKMRYSQEYMAARMSISQNAYSKLERGVTNLTLEHIGLIANILDANFHDLVQGQPSGSGTDNEHQQ